MTQLTLTPEQSEIVVGATGDVPVLDSAGIFLGYLNRNLLTPEQIAEALSRRHYSGPLRTSEQVMARLDELERQ